MRRSVLLAAMLLLPHWCSAAEPAYEPEGTLLTTGSAPSEVSLLNGVSVSVSPRSSGTVYDDHLVLDSGSIQVGNFDGYTIDAGALHIQTQDPGSRAVVRMANNTIEVASLGGNLNVSQGGAMLARVTAGTRASFMPKDKDKSGTYTSYHDRHLLLWIIVGTAAAALVIGITAAAQGKSL